MDFDTNPYSDEELHAELDRLFPHGFSGSDVFQELAPGGWATSPLFAVFHPSVDQLYEEALVMHRNLGEPAEARRTPPRIARTDPGRDRQGVSRACRRARGGSPRAGRPVPLGYLLRRP